MEQLRYRSQEGVWWVRGEEFHLEHVEFRRLPEPQGDVQPLDVETHGSREGSDRDQGHRFRSQQQRAESWLCSPI